MLCVYKAYTYATFKILQILKQLDILIQKTFLFNLAGQVIINHRELIIVAIHTPEDYGRHIHTIRRDMILSLQRKLVLREQINSFTHKSRRAVQRFLSRYLRFEADK